MRPLVSNITEFERYASIRRAKDLPETFVPQVAHHLEDGLAIPIQHFGVFALLPVREARPRRFKPSIFVGRLQFALHVGAQTVLQEIQRLSDPFAISYRHW